MMKGTLWLIPNVLDDGDPASVLSATLIEQVGALRYFIVENEKSARRFLVRAGYKEIIDQSEWGILNEHTRPQELQTLLEPILQGNDGGILSESGCPGVADPGADLVRLAHQAGIKVRSFPCKQEHGKSAKKIYRSNPPRKNGTRDQVVSIHMF